MTFDTMELLARAANATPANVAAIIADLDAEAAANYDCYFGKTGEMLEAKARELDKRFPVYGCEVSPAMRDDRLTFESLFADDFRYTVS